MTLFMGVDLAWTTLPDGPESGVIAIDGDGVVVDACWCVGLEAVGRWMNSFPELSVLACIDAPLVVDNLTGSRLCERQVGQRYGRWKVAANSTNTSSSRLAGVSLRHKLEEDGWRYDAGWEGPQRDGRVFMECYPYTTIVGASELGYDEVRPTYKRRDAAAKQADAGAWRRRRAGACDELITRLAHLETADPPLRLSTHEATARLFSEASPHDGNRPQWRVSQIEAEYKHREDLLDAVLCAWTGSLWQRHGIERLQVLGDPGDGAAGATILAPARAEQRRT